MVCVSGAPGTTWCALPGGRGPNAVVHNGATTSRPVPGAAARPSSRAGAAREFVLYAGSLDVRKNVDLVLDARERLRARGAGCHW